MNTVYTTEVRSKHSNDFTKSTACSPECREKAKEMLLKQDLILGADGEQDGVTLSSACYVCGKHLKCPTTRPWQMQYWNDVTGEEGRGPFTREEAEEALKHHSRFALAYNEHTGETFDNGKPVPQGWRDMRELWKTPQPDGKEYVEPEY